MASHLFCGRVNLNILREAARKDLREFLDKCSGSKVKLFALINMQIVFLHCPSPAVTLSFIQTYCPCKTVNFVLLCSIITADTVQRYCQSTCHVSSSFNSCVVVFIRPLFGTSILLDLSG